jgi:hypothetical protein
MPNKLLTIEEVEEYRDAMIEDGWTIVPTYGNESVESASKLDREDFTCRALTRRKADGRAIFDLCIWGPDKLVVDYPIPYSFKEIKKNLRKCNYCKAPDVDTVRVGFAGRCCIPCRPRLAQQFEKPGWTK